MAPPYITSLALLTTTTHPTPPNGYMIPRPGAAWSHCYGTAQRHPCLLLSTSFPVPSSPGRPSPLMAVHAQYAAHAFPHDPRTITTRPALDDAMMSASVFLGEPVGGHSLAAAVGGNTAFSGLTTCINNNNNNGGTGCLGASRKRARVGEVTGAGLIADLQGHRALLPPVPVPVPQALAPAGDVQSRLLCSGAASTSGRPASFAPASQGLLSHLYRHGVEMDALIRIENERLRAGLQEARRRHLGAVVSAVDRAAARRLRAAEAELGRALARNAELDERLRQTVAEGRAWQDVARGHEAVAAGLRATLDSLVRSSPPRAEGEDAEDAESCCFEQDEEGEEGAAKAPGGARAACRSCGAADACVLLLPCRHLCLCRGCEAGAEACPVCAAAKNASLHVLLP